MKDEEIISYFHKRHWNRRKAEFLRRRADKTEREPLRPIDYPPQITTDDKAAIKMREAEQAPHRAEIARLDAEITKLQKRRRERDIAEWQFVLASPTALRHVADQVNAHCDEIEREEREQKEEQERQWREWQRRQEDQVLYRRGVFQDPLDILSLPSSATPDEINARFRELTKRLHPDTNSGSPAANTLFATVVRAMDQLRAMGRA
jgi:hypothetical protein